MKKRILITLFVLTSVFVFAQKDTGILGEWYTEDKEAIVTISTDGKVFYGTTTWMKEPRDSKGNLKLDKLNPDEKLRTKQRLGLKIMDGFVYKGEDTWDEGRIYKPTNGKTYGGTATLVNENTLDLKGYLLSLPFIGKTSTWTRKTD